MYVGTRNIKTWAIVLTGVLFTSWDYGEVHEFDYVSVCVSVCVCPSMTVTFTKLIFLKELITHSSKEPLSFFSSPKRGLVTKKTEWEKFYKHLEDIETMQNKHSGIINSKSCWTKLRGFFLTDYKISGGDYG